MEVEVHAPYDFELNPVSEEGNQNICDEQEPDERRVVKVVPWSTNVMLGKRKTRWDSGEKITAKKVSTDGSKTMGNKIPIKPQHWRNVQGVTGKASAESISRSLVQKILFADACCGTSTPNATLDQILRLF